MDNSSCVASFVPRFDAYAASVKGSAADILEALEGVTHGAQWEPLNHAPHGYGIGWRLVDGFGQVGQVWAGGRFERPHVSVQGEASPAVAGILRECFPDHGVARADVVALDTVQPGAYDVLQDVCCEVARRRRVEVGTAGDHLVTKDGRTVYLGAPKSHVRLRLYDKAAELRAKLSDPARLAEVPEHLARLELQVRPTGAEGKRRAAYSSPSELLGSARWMREVYRQVSGLEVQPFAVRRVWRQADHEATRWALLRQYHKWFRAELLEVGSPDLVGRQIFDDLAKLESEMRKPRG